MLRWRLLLGFLIVAVLVALAWLDARASIPGLWLAPVGMLATWMATHEVLDLAAAGQLHPLPWTVLLGNQVILLVNWLPLVWTAHSAQRGAGHEAPLLALGACLVVAFFVEIRRYHRPGGVLANLAVTMFTLLYVGLMMAFVAQLRLAWGVGALASMLCVVKAGDIGAYTVGRLIGRHKLAPQLSPGKTIEGAFGALATACLVSWAVFHWLVPWCVTDAAQVSPTWGWMLYGVLVGTAGMVGDLAESLLKRDVGQKDSSKWMPGFGGVLDIVDSVLLAAPVAWLCWAAGWVGK